MIWIAIAGWCIFNLAWTCLLFRDARENIHNAERNLRAAKQNEESARQNAHVAQRLQDILTGPRLPPPNMSPPKKGIKS